MNSKCRRTEGIPLQREPVSIARGKLQYRVDTCARHDGRGGECGHMYARASAIGHVNRVGDTL